MQHVFLSRSSLLTSTPCKSIPSNYIQRLQFFRTISASNRSAPKSTKILPRLRRSNQIDSWNQLITASSQLSNTEFKPINEADQSYMRSTQSTYIWTLMESLKEIETINELEKISEALETAIAFNLDRVLAPKPRRALTAWQYFMKDYRLVSVSQNLYLRTEG